jgi:serine/threonine protein phosphatase 1
MLQCGLRFQSMSYVRIFNDANVLISSWIMSKTFVIGDIHGANRALVQCLERSGFNYASDHLICLGDVCDGWPETKQAIDELMKIKNLTYILGNHDYWTLEWMREGVDDNIWVEQGGAATIQSYSDGVPIEHIEFLEQAKPYLILNNNLFVHAGIDWRVPIERQTMQFFLWDRTMARTAMANQTKSPHKNLTIYNEVYIGHTPIADPPQRMCEIWFMDTGAGWSGKLSMMDIHSKEIFMSDPVPELYPGIAGRSKR